VPRASVRFLHQVRQTFCGNLRPCTESTQSCVHTLACFVLKVRLLKTEYLGGPARMSQFVCTPLLLLSIPLSATSQPNPLRFQSLWPLPLLHSQNTSGTWSTVAIRPPQPAPNPDGAHVSSGLDARQLPTRPLACHYTGCLSEPAALGAPDAHATQTPRGAQTLRGTRTSGRYPTSGDGTSEQQIKRNQKCARFVGWDGADRTTALSFPQPSQLPD
jgi:hypothetical protein